MEAIREVKKRVVALEAQLKNLEIKSFDLDERLRDSRPAMDFSKLEWRKTLPSKQERIWKDECALSFATPYARGGLFTNLKTLTTFSLQHVHDDWAKTGSNCVYLRQQWQWIPDEPTEGEGNHEPEVKKLAIGVEGGFQVESEKGHCKKMFSIATGPNFEEDYAIESAPPELKKLIDIVIERDDASRQMDVLAWEASNDLFESRYARDLPQVENGVKIAGDPKTWKCAESGLTENLWLNLSTGYIGSGRANWDGTGGTGAALRHYEETGRKYPLVVKLGTITPDGKADVYSYAPDEDGMVIDPLLPQHLAHFGINVGEMRKTEKTIAEMEVDLNVKYDWSRISEEGKNLEKVAGDRRVGLVNLGNSCYCNSVYQSLFASDPFNQAVLGLRTKLPPTTQPQFDLLTQLVKLSDAMNDPVRNVRSLSTKPFEGSDYISPRMIKTLLGENHRDFSTTEQQDAAEYVRYILDRLNRACRQANGVEDFSQLFNFEMEERIEDLQSHKVKYRRSPNNVLQLNVPYSPPPPETPPSATGGDKRDVVPFNDCVKATLGNPEIIDDFMSNVTGKRGQASKTTKMATYPKLLIVQLRRFVPSATGWEGVKLECSIPAQVELDLGGEFRATGQRPDEELLPDNPPPVEFVPNQQVLDALTDQGFSRNGAIRAAKATNNNLEAAVNWVMDHMTDADFNDPLPNSTSATASTVQAFVADPQVIASIEGMGFSRNGAIRAAKATNNNGEAAINWVMEHMGDADFNEPLPTEPSPSAATVSTAAAPVEADEESIGMLMSMGFDPELAAYALSKCQNNLERAADFLFSRSKEEVQAEMAGGSNASSGEAASAATPQQAPLSEPTSTKYFLRAVISHVGKSTMSGHYVAHVNQSGPGETPQWVFFNDEKVVLAQSPPLDLGYLFFYEQM